MKPWLRLSKKTVFANRILRLDVERVRTDAGRETDWTVVEIGDGVCVLPIDHDGSLHFIRQYRPAVEAWMLEFPAGRVEPGEEPLIAARRELEEEAGFRADRLEALGSAFPLDGICRHRIHYFRAHGLTAVPTRHEPFEAIENVRVAAADLPRLVTEGLLADGVGMAGLLRHLLAESSA